MPVLFCTLREKRLLMQEEFDINPELLFPVYPDTHPDEQILFLHFLEYENDYPSFEILIREYSYSSGALKVKGGQENVYFRNEEQQRLIVLEEAENRPGFFIAYYSTGPGWFSSVDFLKFHHILGRAQKIFNDELKNKYNYEAEQVSDQ
ncbi:MAG: hypothetical protein H6560_12400 [Lewinellaceae bacterium]|nr:hypothetical protein [Lewinellaceae bacterium]